MFLGSIVLDGLEMITYICTILYITKCVEEVEDPLDSRMRLPWTHHDTSLYCAESIHSSVDSEECSLECPCGDDCGCRVCGKTFVTVPTFYWILVLICLDGLFSVRFSVHFASAVFFCRNRPG